MASVSTLRFITGGGFKILHFSTVSYYLLEFRDWLSGLMSSGCCSLLCMKTLSEQAAWNLEVISLWFDPDMDPGISEELFYYCEICFFLLLLNNACCGGNFQPWPALRQLSEIFLLTVDFTVHCVLQLTGPEIHYSNTKFQKLVFNYSVAHKWNSRHRLVKLGEFDTSESSSTDS